jgi:hypothetical protein
LFDYNPQAAVDLNAGVGVYLTCLQLPRPNGAVPVIMPPTLSITAGPGGIVLQDNVILFPSAYGDLNLVTTGGGSLMTQPNNTQLNPVPELIMSDSSQKRWVGAGTFGDTDHGTVPIELNNPDPVVINISGDMENLILMTSKQTQITVGGDMDNCSFSGQNLHPGDVTSINVAGQIFNRSPYSFVFLSQGIQNLPATDLPPGSSPSWDAILGAALNPVALAALTVTANTPLSDLAAIASQASLLGANPGFVYNSTTLRLGFAGQMSQSVRTALEQPLTVLVYGSDGYPVIDWTGPPGNQTGHFETATVTWVAPSAIEALYQASIGAPGISDPAGLGYVVGGPGQFNVHAGSISLGNTLGILSSGVGDPQGKHRFSNLAPYTPSGATINVTVDGNVEMLTSTIAALGGGDVNVTSTGGSMDLGSSELFNLRSQVAYGIYTSGRGNVNVTALGDIDIDGSRIAAYNGGNVQVESLQGSVNAGSGGTELVTVPVYYVDPVTHQAMFHEDDPFGSGILATTLIDSGNVPGSADMPGNITVETPRGSIFASLGGILQEALNGNVSAGPTITLIAGTSPSGNLPGYTGNIDLGESGVIGGTVNLQANGNITGLVISRQNSTVNAAQSFSGTVLSGGSANLSAGGTISGTVIGVGGINASGGEGVTATFLSQNVSVGGGQVQSTLGSSATATASSQAAVQQASSDTKQQVASDNTQADDEKKKYARPALTRRVGRVTVILPPA